MANIVLKQRDGTEKACPGNLPIAIPTTDGEMKVYTAGEASSKSVSANFAKGDMVIEPDEGTVLSQVTVKKPSTLLPANVASGINIAGVVGTLSTVAKTIGKARAFKKIIPVQINAKDKNGSTGNWGLNFGTITLKKGFSNDVTLLVYQVNGSVERINLALVTFIQSGKHGGLTSFRTADAGVLQLNVNSSTTLGPMNWHQIKYVQNTGNAGEEMSIDVKYDTSTANVGLAYGPWCGFILVHGSSDGDAEVLSTNDYLKSTYGIEVL